MDIFYIKNTWLKVLVDVWIRLERHHVNARAVAGARFVKVVVCGVDYVGARRQKVKAEPALSVGRKRERGRRHFALGGQLGRRNHKRRSAFARSRAVVSVRGTVASNIFRSIMNLIFF